MLQPIAANLWHAVHHFTAAGLPVTSRMTVVRLADGRLWLHSPVPIDAAMRVQLAALGPVAFVVAPNKFHHLFAAGCMAAFPHAVLYGAPGLAAKRPGLRGMRTLGAQPAPEWGGEFEQVAFEGIPIGNEVVFFHKPSATVIMTDLCQWWQGALPLAARVYGRVTGVRSALAVPRTIRLATRDRAAAARSARAILRFPAQRVIVAHNAIVEHDARASLARALAWFDRAG